MSDLIKADTAVKAAQVALIGVALYLVFKTAQKVSAGAATVGDAIVSVKDEVVTQYKEAAKSLDKAFVQGDNPINNVVTDVVTAIAGEPANLGTVIYDVSHHPVDTLKAFWRNHFGGGTGAVTNPAVVTKQGQVVMAAKQAATNDQSMKTLIGQYGAYGAGKLSAGGISADRPSALSDAFMGDITVTGSIGATTGHRGPANPINPDASNPGGIIPTDFGIIDTTSWDENTKGLGL